MPHRSRLSVRNGSLQAALCLLTGVLLAGCAGAQKRYEQGLDLEKRGLYAEAAERYAESLEKQPDQPVARERLLAVGELAVQEYLQEAVTADEAGLPVPAARLLLAADALRAQAAEVGVAVPVPPDYEQVRRYRFDEAIKALLAEGGSAVETGRWATAVSAYEQVEEFEPSPEHVSFARAERASAHVGWGREFLAAGRFRSALQHAESALNLLAGGGGPYAAEAAALRVETVEGGTVWVAFFPLVDMTTGQRPSADLVDELNDLLELDHWARPPEFVASADPILVRREIRREGTTGSSLSVREAARLGRQLGVDFVLIGELEEYSEQERDVRERVHVVGTSGGGETEIKEVRGSLRMEARVSLELVDARRRRSVARGRVRQTASGDFARGEFAGDERELDLSRAQRRLFDPDRQEGQRRRVEDELNRKLSARIARESYTDILRRVP